MCGALFSVFSGQKQIRGGTRCVPPLICFFSDSDRADVGAGAALAQTLMVLQPMSALLPGVPETLMA